MLQQLLNVVGDMQQQNQQLRAEMHQLQAEQDGGKDECEEAFSLTRPPWWL